MGVRLSEAPARRECGGIRVGVGVLDRVENLGNRLPEPLTLFVGMAVAVVLASVACDLAGVGTVHPFTGEAVAARSLLERDLLVRMFTDAVKNFAGFPPLGSVLALVIGVGVCEGSGLFGALLRAIMVRVPAGWLESVTVFAGVMSSVSGDAGYVILLPLAGAAWAAAGRHPLIGTAAAFAGIGAGFSANLFVTALDPLLSGLTEPAARLLDPAATVTPACNWWFMIASTGLLTALGAWVTRRLVAPRVGPWSAAADALAPLSSEERRGLGGALLASVVVLAGIFALAAPSDGLLRAADGGMKPFFDSLIVLLLALFLAAGLGYGVGAGVFRSDRPVVKAMADTMATMGGYIVLAFAIAQFINWFAWSNLGLVVAVEGAAVLRASGVPLGVLLGAFVLLVGAGNLFIGSASAKWALMAPVFVPLFMLLGVDPDVTQAGYRVGDSVSNIVTPLNPYFALVLAAGRRWVPGLGTGSLLALMAPYAGVFMVGWAAMFLAWWALGLPFGV